MVSANPTNIPTALASSAQGMPLTSQALTAINQAAKGGEYTAKFFENMVVTNNFISWLNTMGDQAWIQDTDDYGNPVIFAAQLGGEKADAVGPRVKSLKHLREVVAAKTENAIYMILATEPDTAVIKGEKPPSQFIWNGVTYNTVGSITGTLSYNDQPLWYVKAGLGVAEFIPMAILLKYAWAGLVKPLLTGFWNGVKTCFNSVASDLGLIDEVAEDAADNAAVDGAEIAEDVTVSLKVGGAAMGGFVVLAAIPIILSIAAHPSYHTLQVHNLTPFDLNWQLAYLDEGAMNAAPVTGQGTDKLNHLIPALGSLSPGPDDKPVPVSHEADFSFNSASGYHGLGYVMSFTLTDPANNNQLVGSGAALFFVPWMGENSLYAALTSDSPTYGEAFWQSYYGKKKVTRMVASAQLGGKSAQLTLTYDYLTGQHPNPAGQNCYTYKSLAVFSVSS